MFDVPRGSLAWTAVGATAGRWRGPWKERWPGVSCLLWSSTVGRLTCWRPWPQGWMMALAEPPVSHSWPMAACPTAQTPSLLSPVCVGVVRTLSEYYQAGDSDCIQVWLSADADHFGFSAGDRGWGCGYRNFQMLLSALQRLETYAPVLQG